MRKASFKVTGLHCIEEIHLLEEGLGTLSGVESVLCDLLKGKVVVTFDQNALSTQQIIKRINATGMKGALWEERFALRDKERKERRLHTIFTTLSGLFLVGGVSLQLVAHRLTPQAIFLYASATFFGGFFILPKGLFALKQLRPDMNLLMLIAVTGALCIGEWFEGATVTFLFSVALMLETASRTRARKAVESLLNIAPPFARIQGEQGIEERPVEEVEEGAHIVILPGEKIPLDGVVIEGQGGVNQAPITGESVPVFKGVGDPLFAGTVNEEGRLIMECTKGADQTVLSHIIRLIEESSRKKAPTELWVERFARIYTPAMMALSLVILLGPPLLFGALWSVWFYRALVLLVIACPCALVISTPVTLVSALTSSARAGALVKGGRYLEAMRHIKAIALDKTGTLTQGEPKVQKVLLHNGTPMDEFLSIAAALESVSNHPLAKAVVRYAEGIEIPTVHNVTQIKGKGVQGRVNGTFYWLGSHRFMHEMGQESEVVHRDAVALEDEGHSVIALGTKDHVMGLISIADQVRGEAKETLETLKQMGMREIVMLTGDNRQTAERLAQVVGVTRVKSELLPEEKVAAIEELVGQYKDVAMVGDGINDAPAMARASVGIAMGAIGSDAAIEAADIALMGDELALIPFLIRHSKRAVRIVKQNIAFALSLKALFIALAIFGDATLYLAIAADTGAALVVIANGLRLLRVCCTDG